MDKTNISNKFNNETFNPFLASFSLFHKITNHFNFFTLPAFHTFFSSVDNEQKDDKRNWEKHTRTILFFDKKCPKIKPAEIILKRPKLNASENIYSKV